MVDHLKYFSHPFYVFEAASKFWLEDGIPSINMEFAPQLVPFPIGEMHKFWPQVLQPEGRIYFAGTYADNMSRGMESCLRSARRVAGEIGKL